MWKTPALPRQAIAPSIPYIILLWEKNARRPGRERGTPSILEFYITDLVIGAVKAGGRVLRWRESTYLYSGRLRIRAGESYIVRSRPASTANARKDSFANIATHCEGIGSPLEWVLVMSTGICEKGFTAPTLFKDRPHILGYAAAFWDTPF